MNLHQRSVGEREFHFWSENRFKHQNRIGYLGLFKPPRNLSDDSREDPYSPSSPLLPHKHHCSSLSPSSRTKAIEQGRQELMEMIRNLPESSFELSLKDIVDEHKKFHEDTTKQEDMTTEQNDFTPKEQEQKRRKKAKVTARPSQVLRCSSMDNGVFLIKMFLPAFLTSKKTSLSKPGKQSKVSPRTSVDNISTAEEQSNQSSRSSTSKTCNHRSIRSLSSSCRKPDGESIPGCWPFEMVKGKMRRQKTCVF